MPKITATTVVVATLVALTLGGCASTPAPAAGRATTVGELSGDITVFAAASLTTTFSELATEFEKAHPATTIALNFAGSSDLATQLVEGAPADVFAAADSTNMRKVTDAALNEGEPVDFATNTLEIAVPPGNPARIHDFADLAGPGIALVVCAPAVPCGAATATVEKATGVALAPVSEESSVTDVLGKVTSGEADAGLVYVTDIIAAGDAVEGIRFDESSEAVNTYPIVALHDSEAPDVARAFVAFVASAEGQKVLRSAGFGAP